MTNPSMMLTQLDNTRRLLDNYGASLDKATDQAITRAMDDARAASDWQRPDETPGLVEAAYTALVAGRDPSTDKAVLAAVAGDRVEDLRIAVTNHAGTRLIAAVVELLPGIVAGLDGAYQTHVVEPLTKSAETLEARGITAPDTDPKIVLTSGPAASAAWSTMQAAAEEHARILNAYKLLRATANLPDPEAVMLWADPGELDLLAVRNLHHRNRPHPWTAHRAGMRLALATPTEALARQRGAAERTTEAAEADQRTRREGFVRAFKAGIAR